MMGFKVIKRGEGATFEQVVMGEVLIPHVPNVFGDVYTLEAIQEFCDEFARQGYGIDVDHDEVDLTGDVYVTQSFIARTGDPDFIEGSWVVAMKIEDDKIWEQILLGNIAGYSFNALCDMLPISIQNLRNRQVSGVTEPDPYDGHTHTYLVILNPLNRPISGATGITDGHSHTISVHTVTDIAKNSDEIEHKHRYQVIVEGDQLEGLLNG